MSDFLYSLDFSLPKMRKVYWSQIATGSMIYHLGASLKDLGKKWFAFSKMEIGAVEMLGKLEGLGTVKLNG